MLSLFPYRAPARVVNPGDPIPDLTEFHGTIDFVAEKIRLTSNHLGCLRVILADNAFAPEATCPTFTFRSVRGGRSIWQQLEPILNGITPANIREYVCEIERRHPRHGSTHQMIGTDGQQVHRFNRPASRVYFTPALANVPALDDLPRKWSFALLTQALANGQCSEAYRVRNRDFNPIDPLRVLDDERRCTRVEPHALLEEFMEMHPTDLLSMRWHWRAETRTLTNLDRWNGVHSVVMLDI
ncbi:hypothetical protein AB4Y45_32900 [Paraburkholderia sp. EG287A]|uniref:hypothetical protein n=1 Tax=Paraburkholderia sp. EG287A TaxID=3237012 RepID=UPI0034D2F1D6